MFHLLYGTKLKILSSLPTLLLSRSLMTAEQQSLRAKSLTLLARASDLNESSLKSKDKLKSRGCSFQFPSADDEIGSAVLLDAFSSASSSSFFSVVIAGEFNSGKSTFINALLGSSDILATGCLPTTDQMCIVKTSPPTIADPKSEFYQYDQVKLVKKEQSNISVDVVTYNLSHAYGSTNALLSNLALIDTPGTNAVAELGHEALTKRLLPGADFIIFVTSAERAMSESERGVL